MRTIAAATLCTLGLAVSAEAADYRLTVVETGVRDYYCTLTARLENASDETLDDLNGFFVLLVGRDQVGQSWANSFLNTAPGGATDVLFEAPNAPCADVTDLRFVVGACRVGRSFLDHADCAARLETAAPISEAVPR